jgi:hypothetical protein
MIMFGGETASEAETSKLLLPVQLKRGKHKAHNSSVARPITWFFPFFIGFPL